MVFYQWATIPGGRQHGLHQAILEGQIQLYLSQDLLAEVRDLLGRPNIRAKAPSLTDERVAGFLDAIIAKSHIELHPPKVFTLSQHPDDDHVFNLAIAAKAHYFVTWERRLLTLGSYAPDAAHRLADLSAQLRIINPIDFTQELRALKEKGAARGEEKQSPPREPEPER